MDRTFLHCATRTERRSTHTRWGPFRTQTSDKEMNETSHVRSSYASGRREERSALSEERLQKKIGDEFGVGAGRRAPSNLAFVTGTIWLVTAAPALLPGCSEELLSSLHLSRNRRKTFPPRSESETTQFASGRREEGGQGRRRG